MATITYDAAGPGKASVRPVLAQSPRPMKFVTGKLTFDTAYLTGGEDISDIFAQFSECLGVMMTSPIGSTGTGLHVVIDHTAKTAMLFTNAADPAQVASGSDQSNAADLRFIAFGYA